MQEDDLRRALHRREPTEGFAERTLQRIHVEDTRADEWPVRQGRPRIRAWIAAGLAVAASAVVTIGVIREERVRRDAEARAAARNLEVALQVTSETLQLVQMKVNHLSERSEVR